MTTETRKRIRAYKKALPELRERVIAVALLLAMSASMLGSASFAWLTLSRNPEIKGMNSTVAANGNLEIALVTGDGKNAPAESQVGDSSAASGKSVKDANITWGNLVNLADASYGLENLTLRPAQLNTDDLLNSPLSAADYTQDGRVKRLTTNFKYTSWIIPEDDKETPYFGLAEGMGVRAVSSTAVNANSFAGKVDNMISEVESLNITARSSFVGITDNQDWMKSLATMMGVHMNANLNNVEKYKNAAVSKTDVQNLIDMYTAFEDAFEAELAALTELVNLELYLAYGGDKTKYVDKTKEDILEAIPNLKENGTRDYIAATVPGNNGTEKVVKITNLETFLYNFNMLKTDKEKLIIILNAGDYRWVPSGLNNVILHLVNVDKCMVQFGNDPAMTVPAFLAQFRNYSDIWELMSLASKYSNKQCNAIITNGILYDFEQRVGSKISVKDTSKKDSGLQINCELYSASRDMTVPATVYATISTSAEEPYMFAADLAYAKSMNTGAGVGVGDVTAMDTYGLVIDLWARTNASNSYLMLEGNVLTREKTQIAQGRDDEGNLVDIYILERTVQFEGESGEMEEYTDTYELYQKGSGDTVTWYNAHTYSPFELQDGETPAKKSETIYEIIGYEGENRVWTEDAKPLLTTDATTQGSGSCYVFYADSPQQQTQSLELLRAMRVAFISGDGDLLATARMDPNQAFEDSGRVTVPLVMDTEGVILGEDAQGNITRAITALQPNVPMQITALVYLDGSIIANEHVLSASDIQGQLNIQFGSSADLNAVGDTELEADIRRVSAHIDNTYFDYDNATGDMITNVTLNVEGSEPTTVTASFIRKLNETQGSREEAMVFTSAGNGTWTSSYKFTTPGTYELRTVRLDGVDYDLRGDLPLVTVEGFALDYLNCQQGRNFYRMTAANSVALDLKLKFQTNDPTKMPSSVVGYYVRNDGYQTNVNFTLNATTQEWSGKANFLLSGEYTLQYLELDGENYPLDSSNYQMATIYLGMQAQIWSTSPQDPATIVFDNNTLPEDKVLKMQVKILDNTKAEMMGLDNVKLIYQQRGGARTLDGDLTWNPRTQYYEGNMPATYFGRFSFSRLMVGEDIITVASGAPSFTLVSPDPTEYVGFGRQTAVYTTNGDAALNIRLYNGATATASALIVDQNGNEYTVIADKSTDIGNDQTQYDFRIPTNASGSQDGTWTMLEARIWNAYGENAHEYTQEDPLVIDLRDQNNSVKVTHKVTATFKANQSQDFNGVTGTFMQERKITDVTVTIADANGNVVDVNGDGTGDISDVKIVYEYQGDSLAKGGYSGAAPVDVAFTLNLTSTDGKTFVQSGEQVIRQAGTYAPVEFSFKVYDGTRYTTKTYVNETGKEWPMNVPAFTVNSVTPSVAITQAYYAGASSDEACTVTDTAVTVYFREKTDSQWNGCGWSNFTKYNQPHVVLTLTGYGNADGQATLTFAGSNGEAPSLYNQEGGTNSNLTTDFVWTGDGDCERWVGYWGKKNSGDDEKTPAGTLKATKLILVHDNISYEVDIDDITINNPE